MGTIKFSNRTSEVHYEGELKDVLRDLSQKENLRSAFLPSEVMPGADFKGLKLPFATLSHSDLHDSDFSGAVLYFTHFHGCNLKGCNFEGANLVHADFHYAAIQGASFKGAYMKGCTGLKDNILPEGAIDADPPDDAFTVPNINHWARKTNS